MRPWTQRWSTASRRERAGRCSSPCRPTTSQPRSSSRRKAREAYDPDLVAAAMSQSRLRAKAVDKFGDFAAGMLFTPDELEQATASPLAARHAHRFASAGVRRYDLGGIGADAMAFAGLDPRRASGRRRSATARIAAANLRHWPSARVTRAPTTCGSRSARRPAPRCLARPGSSRLGDRRRPRPDEAGLLARCDLADVAGGAGLRRGHSDHRRQAPRHPSRTPRSRTAPKRVELAGRRRGRVRHLVGPLAVSPGRTAAVCSATATHVVAEADAAPPLRRPAPADSRRPGRVVHEPDRAVTRAGLTGALAAAVDGTEVEPAWA